MEPCRQSTIKSGACTQCLGQPAQFPPLYSHCLLQTLSKHTTHTTAGLARSSLSSRQAEEPELRVLVLSIPQPHQPSPITPAAQVPTHHPPPQETGLCLLGPERVPYTSLPCPWLDSSFLQLHHSICEWTEWWAGLRLQRLLMGSGPSPFCFGTSVLSHLGAKAAQAHL